MKANEMPEKIYLFDYNDAMVTPLEGDTVYVREDAFIEKAKKWFEQQPETYDANGIKCYGMEDFEDFRKYFIDSLQEEPVSRNPADIEAAMQEVEEKSRAYTEAHEGDQGYYKEGGKWVAFDNSTCDCWVEEFNTRKEAIDWLGN